MVKLYTQKRLNNIAYELYTDVHYKTKFTWILEPFTWNRQKRQFTNLYIANNYVYPYASRIYFSSFKPHGNTLITALCTHARMFLQPQCACHAHMSKHQQNSCALLCDYFGQIYVIHQSQPTYIIFEYYKSLTMIYDLLSHRIPFRRGKLCRQVVTQTSEACINVFKLY